MRTVFELQDPLHARLLPMEGLRGFAVILVFLQHYMVQAQLIGLPPGLAHGTAAAFRTYGNLGVELFFVLSGYLIYGTLVRRAPPFGRFMLRRLQRIYPAFLVVFAFALALNLLAPVAPKVPADPWAAAAYLGANLGLVAGLVPMPRIVDVAWSLSYEMFFYVAAGALVLGAGLGRLAAPWRIAWVAVLGLAFLLVSFMGLPWFPVRMMPFFAGMLLAEGLGRRVPPWTAWAAVCVGFLAAVTHAVLGPAGDLVQTVAFFCLCAVCFRGAGRVSVWMTWTPLRWLGNMSYSYYLVHSFVVRVAMVLLARVLPEGMPAWLFWGFMPVLFAATLVASAVLFVTVERPVSLRPAGEKLPRTASA